MRYPFPTSFLFLPLTSPLCRRSLLANLSKLPQLQPLDWRRSKIRREHLISMGIPVNLDDVRSSRSSFVLLARTDLLSPSRSPPNRNTPPSSSPAPASLTTSPLLRPVPPPPLPAKPPTTPFPTLPILNLAAVPRRPLPTGSEPARRTVRRRSTRIERRRSWRSRRRT